MSDWNTPDPWERPAPGWGAPPSPPPPPRDPGRWMPLAVVLVVALCAAGIAVVARSKPERPVAQRPAPVATPAKPKAPKPTKPPAPRRTTKPKPAKAAPPQPVRTYTAPPAGIPVRGRVLDASGRPVSGADVRLERHEGFFEGFGRALAVFASLGLACIADDEICEVPYGVGRTDASGRYTVFLEKDVDDYDVRVQQGSTGPVLTARIDYAGKPLVLPDVHYWNPAPFAEARGTDMHVRFRTPPARVGTWRGAGATVKDAKDNVLVTLDGARSGDSFDARLIEDVAARLDVGVTVRTKLGDTTYTASAPVRGRLRPMTRGLACYEYGRSGRPVRNAPCALTDGDLLTEWQPKVADYQCADNSPCDRRVMVDLGSQRRLRYVVVRTCDDFFDEVQVSADGKTWQTVIEQHSGQGGDINDVCHRELDTTARYVRVKGPAGGFYTRRSEISVF